MSVKQRWVGVVVLVLTFMAGGIAGAAMRSVVAEREPERADQTRDGDRQDRHRKFPYELLGVSDEQRTQIEAVFEQHRAQMDALWREYQPRFDQVVDSTRAGVNAVLTVEQRQKFEELRARRREMNKEQERRQQDEGNGSGHEEKGGDLL
jgi:Spy/CpxP family protein refolding chaperone